MKGHHLILDLFGVDRKLLDDEEEIMRILKEVSEKCGMRIIKGAYHKFTPQGVTAFYILAESHISIHTWPEYGDAAVDVYYCGDKKQVEKAGELLVEYFKPKRVIKRFFERSAKEKPQ